MTLLPYPEMPNFICYHNKAFPFGIIQANSPEDITKWLCTKCINTVYNPNSPKNKFDLAIWDTWGNWEGITTQQIFNIKYELFPLINLDLINVFRTFIDNKCYVHGTYNEKYVPLKWAYNVEDYVHDFLVIGYDEENFHSLGFIADGRFKHFMIPNKNLERAKLVHMLGLKMEMTDDSSLIHRITDLIDIIIEDEKRYIPQLTLLLKSKHDNGII